MCGECAYEFDHDQRESLEPWMHPAGPIARLSPAKPHRGM
jgi:hypothetical protein